MLYVVTGFPRSGTSMMMRCLQFAGIEPIVSASREAAMAKRNKGEYAANPYGFFETEERDALRVGFLESIDDNRCIKLMPTSLTCLPVRPTTVIWMRRDPTEIRQSYERTFPQENFDKKFPQWPRTHDVQIQSIQPILKDRRSITLIELQYADVVDNPSRALRLLQIVNASRAAMAVDASLYRNRVA
jgi:hypothetical protein